MGAKRYEAIPYHTFKERVAITKALNKKGITSRNFEDLGNCLLVYHSTIKGWANAI